MRGISKEKADQNAIRYRGIYEKWQTEESITLEQLGKEHEVTKQRMWQIITRCKLGNGLNSTLPIKIKNKLDLHVMNG